MHGLINVLKPPGVTSHDVVIYLRKLFDLSKIGHTGTLDPGATGVLPVCVGQGTRVAEFLIDKPKSYRVEMTLGIKTDTYDAEGKIIKKNLPPIILEDEIENVLKNFVGEVKQIPPMMSAIHYNGKRLYELARQGKTVERKARKVVIFSIKLLKIYQNGLNYPRILFDISCSKGTYVRSICAEIGERLRYGAYLSFLIRTASGPFNICNSFTLEEIKKMWKKGDLSFLLPIDYALQDLPLITIKDKFVNNIINGLPLASSGIMGGVSNSQFPPLVRLYSPSGLFLAIGELQGQRGGKWFYKPKKVFHLE